jgi:hypothetical protein
MVRHNWTPADQAIVRRMKQVGGIKNLSPKDRARLQYIFTKETGLP